MENHWQGCQRLDEIRCLKNYELSACLNEMMKLLELSADIGIRELKGAFSGLWQAFLFIAPLRRHKIVKW
mgnify:CR=1 FL=1